MYGNVAAASKIFNPDMAVIGDFLGAAGDDTVKPEPALRMRKFTRISGGIAEVSGEAPAPNATEIHRGRSAVR